MAVFNKVDVVTVLAQEDLDSHQFFAFAFSDGKIANNGGEASGIIYNKPKNLEHAQIAWRGDLKFRAGGTITAGAGLTVTTSGWVTVAGSGYYTVGRAVSAATSGSVGRGIFDFSKAFYAISSIYAWL